MIFNNYLHKNFDVCCYKIMMIRRNIYESYVIASIIFLRIFCKLTTLVKSFTAKSVLKRKEKIVRYFQ